MRVLAIVALLLSLAIASFAAIATPAGAQPRATANRIDEAAFAYWAPRHSGNEASRAIDALPPVSEWTGDIRACDADHNPPEWMTRFGGFCQQIAVPAKRSLLYTGEDLIFGFKHP